MELTNGHERGKFMLLNLNTMSSQVEFPLS